MSVIDYREALIVLTRPIYGMSLAKRESQYITLSSGETYRQDRKHDLNGSW